MFDEWVEKVFNRMPSKGKNLNGLSPDDLWALENPIKRVVAKEALMLCCMRTTKNLKITRNGIRDPQFKVNYFAPWILEYKGKEVYLRIDPEDYSQAYVSDAVTDAYLGEVAMREKAAAFADTPVEKDQLREMRSIQRKQRKMAKEPSANIVRQSTQEILDAQLKAASLFGNNVEEREQNVSRIVRTPLDGLALDKRRQAESQRRYANDHERAIIGGLWVKDEKGKKIRAIIEWDLHGDYYEAHEAELVAMANSGL